MHTSSILLVFRVPIYRTTKTNLKASTKTRTFSTQKNHEKTTNYFYSTHCKRLLSLVLTLDCMSLPMMPLSLLPVEAIIDITNVDILNFQPFLFSTMGSMGNCKPFKILAIAKFLQYLSPFDKLNARTKRKTEYFSFLKHPFLQILTTIKMTDYLSQTSSNSRNSRNNRNTAVMTAFEQQTGVTTRVNE